MVENSSILLLSMFLALACFMYLGWRAGKKTSDTSADYMAAGGNMPYWITTATLLATFICGGTVLGGAGIGFSQGMQATIPDPFAACLCLIAGGLIFQGIIRKTGALSAAVPRIVTDRLAVLCQEYVRFGRCFSLLVPVWQRLETLPNTSWLGLFANCNCCRCFRYNLYGFRRNYCCSMDGFCPSVAFSSWCNCSISNYFNKTNKWVDMQQLLN